MIFKYLNLLILSAYIIESTSIARNVVSNEVLPEGDTTGVCSLQLNPQPHKRNCRYGKCELILNGTDFACHCDEFITGKKCDRPVKDRSDPCSSNPCWGESECVIPDSNVRKYECVCPNGRSGKYCELKSANVTQKVSLSTSITTTSTKSLIPITTTRNITNIEKSTVSLKMLNETSVIIGKQTTLENTMKNKTIVPIAESLSGPSCNYETCQLGKCLKNGSCECVSPAYGKYCDRINECLIIKCINGNCSTGKGCVCDKGFTGAQCETPVQTTPSNSIMKNSSVNRKILVTRRPIKSNSTRLHKTRVKSTKTTEIPLTETTSATTSTSTTSNTPLVITSCENGGLLIDNSCLCLNQYTGPRCETTPEQALLNENDTSLYMSSKQTIIPKIKSASNPELSKNKNQLTMNQENENSSSLKRLNSKIDDENTSVIERSEDQNKMNWPWLECFPGDALVYVKDDLTSYKAKKMSELNINDMVLINENTFSKVITFLHKIESINAKFIRLYYNQEQSHITLTPKHLISVKSDNRSEFDYIAANQVQIGDELNYFDLKLNKNHIVKVKRIELIESNGIYAPLTESGTLIVDNIYVSCYSLVKSHQAAHFFFNILFIIKKFIMISSDACLDYAKYLYDFVEYFKLSDLFLNIKS